MSAKLMQATSEDSESRSEKKITTIIHGMVEEKNKSEKIPPKKQNTRVCVIYDERNPKIL